MAAEIARRKRPSWRASRWTSSMRRRGDPWIGGKLERLAREAGFARIECRSIALVGDDDHPDVRAEMHEEFAGIARGRRADPARPADRDAAEPTRRILCGRASGAGNGAARVLASLGCARCDASVAPSQANPPAAGLDGDGRRRRRRRTRGRAGQGARHPPAPLRHRGSAGARGGHHACGHRASRDALRRRRSRRDGRASFDPRGTPAASGRPPRARRGPGAGRLGRSRRAVQRRAPVDL